MAMKREIAKLQKKYMEKTFLFYAAFVFLKTAFEEATEKNHKSLAEVLSLFRKAMPDSLKRVHSDEEPDYERYFYNLQFIELVSNIELFFIEVITLVVSKHPHKIGRQQVSVSDVIEFGCTTKVVEKACTEYLNSLTYKKPSDYKNEFLKLLSANDDLIDEEWPKFIEMKARRDLGVHNDWYINETYERKIKEVGFPVLNGVDYMYPSGEYMHRCVMLAHVLYKKICAHVEQKYS